MERDDESLSRAPALIGTREMTDSSLRDTGFSPGLSRAFPPKCIPAAESTSGRSRARAFAPLYTAARAVIKSEKLNERPRTAAGHHYS